MAEFTEAQIQERVRAKVVAGDFFFPEDLARAIAKQLGVDIEGTPMAPVAPENSPTRGDVPPFSGRPYSDEHATEHAKAAVAAYDEQRNAGEETTTTKTNPRPTKAAVFEEAGDPLEGAPNAEEAANSEQDIKPESLTTTDASPSTSSETEFASGGPVTGHSHADNETDLTVTDGTADAPPPSTGVSPTEEERNG